MRRGLTPSPDWVYPRVGGGTTPAAQVRPRVYGLSPRGRGNPAAGTPAKPQSRSIPAWAGEPSSAGGGPAGITVYPRVGGGTGAVANARATLYGLSPRGRGNPVHSPRMHRLRRSIPAWAGEPPVRLSPVLSVKVYPRVGGGTTLLSHAVSSLKGLSPRGRGNQTLEQANVQL